MRPRRIDPFGCTVFECFGMPQVARLPLFSALKRHLQGIRL